LEVREGGGGSIIHVGGAANQDDGVEVSIKGRLKFSGDGRESDVANPRLVNDGMDILSSISHSGMNCVRFAAG
jgi:hypothetical protein